MRERLRSVEGNSLSSALDSGKGKEKTWKRFAWKLAGYSALITGGLFVIASL